MSSMKKNKQKKGSLLFQGYRSNALHCYPPFDKNINIELIFFDNLASLFPDVDECKTEQHECDEAISACENTKGSFKCHCLKGYFKSGQHQCTGNIHFKIS